MSETPAEPTKELTEESPLETVPEAEVIPEQEAPTVDATSVETQFGLKYPNGDIEWAKSDGGVELSNGGSWHRFSLKEPSADLSQFLVQRAVVARLDPELYVGSHQDVARTITTLTSAPFPAIITPVQ